MASFSFICLHISEKHGKFKYKTCAFAIQTVEKYFAAGDGFGQEWRSYWEEYECMDEWDFVTLTKVRSRPCSPETGPLKVKFL